MKKKIITRSLLGFPLGIALGVVIALCQSFASGETEYVLVSPRMLALMPNELIATLWQTILCGLLGAICAGVSPVFEHPTWSLLLKTLVHFVGIIGSVMAFSLLSGWLPNGWAVALYLLIAVVMYAVIWIILTLYWRSKVRELNERLTK